MNWYKQSQSSGPLYHVTHTNNVPVIVANGINPLQKSQWCKGTGERYGKGEIFACDSLRDAIRWGSKMDWEFYGDMGTGNISIVEFERGPQEWEADESDPVSQLGNVGKWLKRLRRVRPEEIQKTYPITIDMMKNITRQ